MINNDKIEMYMNQDIDNPIFLFHGSPLLLQKLIPKQSSDSSNDSTNIDNAVFLFPSFLKSTPYAFKDSLKQYEIEGQKWNFEIPNDNSFPLMTIDGIDPPDDLIGYIYVIKKDDEMVKDEKSYQYKCHKEIIPYDIIEVHYKDFKDYFENRNNKKKSKN